MPKKFPPLSPQEVIRILRAWGFELARKGASDHQQWAGFKGNKQRLVTVDMGVDEFDDWVLKSMIEQSGLSREEFYCATKESARKISKPYQQPAPEPKPAQS